MTATDFRTTMTDCKKCGEPVEGGQWHRSCLMASLGAVLAQTTVRSTAS